MIAARTISHGFKQWHIASKKIATPLDLEPQSKPSASVIKHFPVLQSQHYKKVYL
jgi:hypothetical protein